MSLALEITWFQDTAERSFMLIVMRLQRRRSITLVAIHSIEGQLKSNEEDKIVAASKIQYSSTTTQGKVIYRTVCQNPGCGHAFDLSITRSNLGVLSSRMACPGCHRPGGVLKCEQRLAQGIFLSRLMFHRIESYRQ
jgi:hypothetical protein